MKTLHQYFIRFTFDGASETQVDQFLAGNPGEAFEKCRQKYPGCKLLKGWREGRLVGGLGKSYGLTDYDPPSTIKVEAGPESKAEEIKFPFWDYCLGKRPLS
jgi:hypothetical protein